MVGAGFFRVVAFARRCPQLTEPIQGQIRQKEARKVTPHLFSQMRRDDTRFGTTLDSAEQPYDGLKQAGV